MHGSTKHAKASTGITPEELDMRQHGKYGTHDLFLGSYRPIRQDMSTMTNMVRNEDSLLEILWNKGKISTISKCPPKERYEIDQGG